MDIQTYTPSGISEAQWQPIAAFVRSTTMTAQERHAGRYITKNMVAAVTILTHWATQVACLPLETSVVFHRDTIAEFIASGCERMNPNSRSSRRSMLLRVAEAVLPEGERVTRLQAVHKDNPGRPYSEFEQRALRSWAEGQTTPARRVDCRTILALGLGAGLATPDILALRAQDIVSDDLGVLIQVDRPGSTRDVPVLWQWEDALVDLLAVRDPGEWAVGTQRTGTSSNSLNAFLSKTQPEAGKRPRMTRLRNTWLVHHLSTGTPLGPLSVAAGLETFRTIEKLLPFLPEPSRAQVRTSMRRPLRSVG